MSRNDPYIDRIDTLNEQIDTIWREFLALNVALHHQVVDKGAQQVLAPKMKTLQEAISNARWGDE